MKRIWITALEQDQAAAERVGAALEPYGMEVAGHFWEDNIVGRAWMHPIEDIAQRDVWLVLAGGPELGKPSVRLGLSLTAIGVQARRGHGFPILLVHTGEPASADSLPTPLRSAEVTRADDPMLGATVTARAFAPAGPAPDYRLDVHGLPQGICFEAGPVRGSWNGALFGVTDSGTISVQAVGPRGQLPEKTTLNYPMRDLKLELGGKSYTAWATRNPIEADSSHYVLLHGEPAGVLFGAFPDADSPDAELYSVRLI